MDSSRELKDDYSIEPIAFIWLGCTNDPNVLVTLLANPYLQTRSLGQLRTLSDQLDQIEAPGLGIVLPWDEAKKECKLAIHLTIKTREKILKELDASKAIANFLKDKNKAATELAKLNLPELYTLQSEAEKLEDYSKKVNGTFGFIMGGVSFQDEITKCIDQQQALCLAAKKSTTAQAENVVKRFIQEHKGFVATAYGSDDLPDITQLISSISQLYIDDALAIALVKRFCHHRDYLVQVFTAIESSHRFDKNSRLYQLIYNRAQQRNVETMLTAFTHSVVIPPSNPDMVFMISCFADNLDSISMLELEESIFLTKLKLVLHAHPLDNLDLIRNRLRNANFINLYTHVITVIEAEYSRLQQAKESLLTQKAGTKTAILYGALDNLVEPVYNYLMNGEFTELNAAVKAVVTACSDKPVLNSDRNYLTWFFRKILEFFKPCLSLETISSSPRLFKTKTKIAMDAAVDWTIQQEHVIPRGQPRH